MVTSVKGPATDEDSMVIIITELSKHGLGKEVRALLTQYGTPSNIISQGGGALAASEMLCSAFKYYYACRDAGYSAQWSIEGATRGAIVSTYLSNTAAKVIIYSAEVVTIGGAEIATGAGIPVGVVTVGVGFTGALIGAKVINDADSLGENIALTHCLFASNGGYINAITGSIYGFFSKNKDDQKTVQLSPIENNFTEQAISDFEKSVKNDPYLSIEEKNNILEDFYAQSNTYSYLEDILHYNYSDASSIGIALLSRPTEAIFYSPGPAIKTTEKNGETIFEYDLEAFDYKIAPDSSDWANMQQYIANHNGVLTTEGQFKNSNAWFPGKKLPVASTNKHYSVDEQSIDRQLKYLFHLEKEQNEKLDAIYKNVTVTLGDGSVLSVAELVCLGINYNLKKDEEAAELAKEQKKQADYIASAKTISAIGVFIGNKNIENFGYALEYIFNIGFSSALAFSGDLTAIAMFTTNLMGLVGIFHKKEMVDPNQIILQALQGISAQIEELRGLVIDGLFKIDDSLNKILYYMLENFQTVYLEIYISRLITNQKLDQLQHNIHQLSVQLNKQIHGLWLRDLIDARFAIVNYKRRYNELDNVPVRSNMQALTVLADILVNWFTNKSRHYNSTGAHLYYVGCPVDKALSVVSSAEPEDIIGFLIAYVKYELDITFDISTDSINNPTIWLLAVDAFIELINGIKPTQFFNKYDSEHNIYQDLLLSGNKLLLFFQALRSNTDLFPVLLEKYGKILNAGIKPVFAELLEEKRNAQQSSAMSQTYKTEESKLNRGRQSFSQGVATNVPVKKGENAGVQNTINFWNHQIAKEIVPKFFSEYQLFLQNEFEIQQDYNLPLTRFYVTENDFLLPLSMLFKKNETLPQTFQLPTQLLLAEKLGIGNFEFSMADFQCFTIGGMQNNPENIQIIDTTIVVTITFNRKEGTCNVATVNLNVNPGKHHSAVFQIKQAATINSIYGAETGHPYYQNATQTLSKVILLSAWQNADVSSFEITYDPDSDYAKAIDTALQGKLTVDIISIYNDLQNNTPNSAADGINYAASLIKFINQLDILELRYQLLISFGKLAGFSIETINNLKRLWNKEHVLAIIGSLCSSESSSNVKASTEQSMATALNSLNKAVDIHLQEVDDHTQNSPHTSLSVSSISYLEVGDMIYDELQSAKDKPFVSHSLLQTAILSLLRSLVEKEQLEKLEIIFEEDWLAENFSWYQKSLYNPNAQTIHTEDKQTAAYSIDDVEKLLVYDFEIDQEGAQAKILPTILPALELPKFFTDQIINNISATLVNCRKHGKPIIIPICIQQTEGSPPVQQNFWKLVIASFDKPNGNVAIVYIDPFVPVDRTINPASQNVDINAEYQDDDAQKQNLVNQIRDALLTSTIPGQIIIANLGQIPQTWWKDSGAVLIKNAQDLLDGQEINPQITDQITTIRRDQATVLEKINSNFPNLRATSKLEDANLNVSEDTANSNDVKGHKDQDLILAAQKTLPVGYQLVYTADNNSYYLVEEKTSVEIPSHPTGNSIIHYFAGSTAEFSRINFDLGLKQAIPLPAGYKWALTQGAQPREITMVNDCIKTQAQGSTRWKVGRSWSSTTINCVSGTTVPVARCVFVNSRSSLNLEFSDAFPIPNGYHLVAIKASANELPILRHSNEGITCTEAGNSGGNPPAGIVAHGKTSDFPHITLSSIPIPPQPNNLRPIIAPVPVAVDPVSVETINSPEVYQQLLNLLQFLPPDVKQFAEPQQAIYVANSFITSKFLKKRGFSFFAKSKSPIAFFNNKKTETTKKISQGRLQIAGLLHEPVSRGGHCFYDSIRIYLGENISYRQLRNEVATYLENHLDNDEELNTIFTALLADGQIREEKIRSIRETTEWGGHLEMSILVKIYNRSIVIINPNGTIRNLADIPQLMGEPIFVYYNGYNHYERLRLAPGANTIEIYDRLKTITIASSTIPHQANQNQNKDLSSSKSHLENPVIANDSVHNKSIPTIPVGSSSSIAPNAAMFGGQDNNKKSFAEKMTLAFEIYNNTKQAEISDTRNTNRKT